MQGLKFLTILLPSIWIHYTFSGIEGLPRFPYWERYGAGDHLLELYFDTNPKGRFQKNRLNSSVSFQGYWVTKEGESKIRGSRLVNSSGRVDYLFVVGRDRYLGVQQPPVPHRCEPSLEIFEQNSGQPLRQVASLHGSFCL